MTDYVSQLTNRTLRVVLHKERPFVRLTTDNYDPTDVRPDQVEGEEDKFIVEMEKFAKNVVFPQRSCKSGIKAE